MTYTLLYWTGVVALLFLLISREPVTDPPHPCQPTLVSIHQTSTGFVSITRSLP